jgi:hypothetical protein
MFPFVWRSEFEALQRRVEALERLAGLAGNPPPPQPLAGNPPPPANHK